MSHTERQLPYRAVTLLLSGGDGSLPTGAVPQRTMCYLGRLDNLWPPDWLRLAERLPDPAWWPRLQAEVG